MTKYFLILSLLIAGIVYANTDTTVALPNCLVKDPQILAEDPPPSNVPARSVVLSPDIRDVLARYIGWQESPNPQNLCGGYYQEPLLTYAAPSAVAEGASLISASQASLFPSGKSTLQGEVSIAQQGKQLKSDTAYIYRDAKTGKITHVDLYGNAELREPGRLLVGQQGHFDPLNNSGNMDNGVYRFAFTQPQVTEGQIIELFGVNGWGRAARVTREANGNYQMEKATYATCPPQDRSWEIDADHITLDRASGRGYARNVVFNINDWPVFYTPYYSFPIDDRRSSGFLTPVIGYSNTSGAHLALPYYLNLAPNYDATITPMYYSLRGAMAGGEFRYLTNNSSGEISGSIMPHDQAFKGFINANEAKHPELSDLSTTRDDFYFQDNTRINEHVTVDGLYQTVSDDYFLQDFRNSLDSITTNQLLRQGDITYADDHWLAISRVQNYLTLHPINQTATTDAYNRYPQLILNGNYDDLPGGFTFAINNEYDDFIWPQDDQNIAEGNRYHTDPIVSRPWRTVWGYFTPTLQLQETDYDLTQNVNDLDRSLNIAVPQFDVDSGLYFDRNTQIAGHDYTQTLEPRLYYLYVPLVNQREVPVFDTNYYIFTYDQMFRTNRFTGEDRVGDANQLTLALSSRLIDSDSGIEKMHVSIGDILYFENRHVQLLQQTSPNQPYADSPTTTVGYVSPVAPYSPIAGQVAYSLTQAWSVIGDIAWDPYLHQTNNGTLNLHYQPGTNRIINVAYSYLVNGDQAGITNTTEQSPNFHQITLSYAWPLTRQWSSLGAVGYNISHDYAMQYVAGLQYESCCWALRIMGGRVYQNLTNNNQPVYNNNVYLQVLFKGLGTVANRSPKKLIAGDIAGYQDIFK